MNIAGPVIERRSQPPVRWQVRAFGSARQRMPWPILLLVAYLGAITIIGKGPTYLGYPPIFWGEVTLVATLLWSLRANTLPRAKERESILVVAFVLVGACLTALSWPRWGLDAIRDAAIWYYAGFYFVGLVVARHVWLADRVWRSVQMFWVISLLWGTAELASHGKLSTLGPVLPSRGVTLFFNSLHESGQNLALGAVLVLCSQKLPIPAVVRALLFPVAICGLLVFAADEGRGMRMGFAVGTLVLAVLLVTCGPTIPLVRRLTALAVIGIIFGVAVLLLVPSVASALHLDRFALANPSAPEGTANWRLIWWQRLAEAVMSRNPLFGLGFGESLNVYHPMIERDGGAWVVRSPHNFNVTIFARMGIVGALLWAGIVVVGFGTLIVRITKGRYEVRRYSPQLREELAFWLFMLVFTVVNSSFGVLMEGPVLGVWFWFALGFALGRSHACVAAPFIDALALKTRNALKQARGFATA